MGRTSRSQRLGLGVLVGAALLCEPATAAGAAGGPVAAAGATGRPATATAATIGTEQHFIGLVDGRHKNATIDVVCPGPAGGTGHPKAGQHLSLRRVRAGGGYTGNIGGVVFARLSTNPKDRGVLFKAYGTRKIPTSWRVPCSATGHVVFRLLPIVAGAAGRSRASGGARPDIVRVTFENVAV